MPLNYLAGEADAVYRRIADLLEQSQADEVMITTMLPSHQDRERTLDRMATAFGLGDRAVSTPFPEG